MWKNGMDAKSGVQIWEESAPGPIAGLAGIPAPSFLFAQLVAEPAKTAAPRTKRQLIADLRQAVVDAEFELEYQPIVNSLTGEITAFEALLRWNHPLQGRVGPAEFIPLAEQHSLMPRLGAWVIGKACQECAKWPGGVKVSVNMSASQFNDPAVERVVCDALAAAGLSPGRLQLELTETFLLSDSRALRTLSQLHSTGVAIALDDFGTGYSSLSYLHTFPFDKIKIDRCFIRETDQCRHSYRMLEALMRFAAVLDIPTVVEGVETAQQLETIKSFGPCEIQGFLFGRPMGAAKVPGFLADGLR
jgi:EAL domain-containing protein (putative c-di-GMP-specific phosphodiesterase class I)